MFSLIFVFQGQDIHKSDKIWLQIKYGNCLPLTDAVRVQLYKIASSPKARPAAIFPKALLSFNTSNSPSAENKK